MISWFDIKIVLHPSHYQQDLSIILYLKLCKKKKTKQKNRQKQRTILNILRRIYNSIYSIHNLETWQTKWLHTIFHRKWWSPLYQNIAQVIQPVLEVCNRTISWAFISNFFMRLIKLTNINTENQFTLSSCHIYFTKYIYLYL